MAKCLQINRVDNADYKTLKAATQNFQNPAICTLNQTDAPTISQLQQELIGFEKHHRDEVFSHNDNLQQLYNVTDYSRGDDFCQGAKGYSISFIFLTKDKIISPVGYHSAKHNVVLEAITRFFFDTPLLREKFTAASLWQKLFIYTSLRKGIFGKFNLANLSNLVYISTWYSGGGTNTVIHTDNGLCNLFFQLQGRKRWWIASQLQPKQQIQEVFNRDITTLDLSKAPDLEYYDFELNQGEMLFLPANWLHGVISAEGLNLSISFLFPMTIRELVANMIHWGAMGVPLNQLKQSKAKEGKSMADLNAEHADAFNQLKFHLRQHAFSSRQLAVEEPEVIVGLYDIDKIAKTITGAE